MTGPMKMKILKCVPPWISILVIYTTFQAWLFIIYEFIWGYGIPQTPKDYRDLGVHHLPHTQGYEVILKLIVTIKPKFLLIGQAQKLDVFEKTQTQENSKLKGKTQTQAKNP